MYIVNKIMLAVVLILAVTACQSLAGENIPATLHADMTMMATEAAGIQFSAGQKLTEAAATIPVAETQVAAYSVMNNVLRSTMQAVQTPTPALRAVVADSGSVMSADMIDTSDGVMRFMQVGITDALDNDGCFSRHVNIFRPDFTQIYLVALGVNVEAGTNLNVNWRAGQDIVHRNGWTAPGFASTQCIAIPLNASRDAIIAGNWEAFLYVNGQEYESTVFTIFAQ